VAWSSFLVESLFLSPHWGPTSFSFSNLLHIFLDILPPLPNFETRRYLIPKPIQNNVLSPISPAHSGFYSHCICCHRLPLFNPGHPRQPLSRNNRWLVPLHKPLQLLELPIQCSLMRCAMVLSSISDLCFGCISV